MDNSNNYMETAVVLKCPEEGRYVVEYKGESWEFVDFVQANEKMQSLIRPPQGDPK